MKTFILTFTFSLNYLLLTDRDLKVRKCFFKELNMQYKYTQPRATGTYLMYEICIESHVPGIKGALLVSTM